MPNEFQAIISNIKNNVPNIDKAVFSVHCHNDLGFAVSNSIASLDAGVRQMSVLLMA